MEPVEASSDEPPNCEDEPGDKPPPSEDELSDEPTYCEDKPGESLVAKFAKLEAIVERGVLWAEHVDKDWASDESWDPSPLDLFTTKLHAGNRTPSPPPSP